MILRTHMVEEKNLSWNLHIHVLACMLPLPGLLINTRNNKKKNCWGWRVGSAVKSTDCSFEGPEFNSQQPT